MPPASDRRRVLPLLERPAFFEAADEAAPDVAPILRFPLVPGELLLGLVLPGEGGALRFLSAADAGRYERDPAALEREALQNLESLVRGKLTIAVKHGIFARIEEAPWFRATLAALPSVRSRLAAALGEAPAIALPSRDDLVALAPRARPVWAKGLPRLRRDHAEARHPLSDALFLATQRGLELAGPL